MPEDIASLGVSVTDNAQATTKNLNDLTVAAMRAEIATKALGVASDAAYKSFTPSQIANVSSSLKNYTVAQQAAIDADLIATKAKQQLSAAQYINNTATDLNTKSVINNRVAYEATIAVHEALSGRWSRLTGTSMILTQAMAGNTATAGFLTAVVSPLGLAIGAVVAITLAATVAGFQYEEQQKKMIESTLGLGAASRTSAEDIAFIGEETAKANGLSIASSQQAASAYQSMGIIGQDNILGLTEVTGVYAQMVGEKLPQAQSDLAKAFDGTAKNAFDFNDKLHDLNISQLQEIQNLSDAGDKAGVQRIALEALTNRTDEVTKATGGLNNFFTVELNRLSDLWTMVGKVDTQYRGLITTIAAFSGLGFGNLNINGPQAKAGDPGVGAAIAAQGAANLIHQQAFDIEQSLPNEQLQSKLVGLQGTITKLTQERNLDPVDSQAWEKANEALGRYGNTLDRVNKNLHDFGGTQLGIDQEIATLQTKLKDTPRGTGRTGIENQIYGLQHQFDIETDPELSQRAGMAGSIAGAKAPKSGGSRESNQDRYTDQTAQINAQAAALLLESDAWSTSGLAAFEAKAKADAYTDALKASHGPHGEVISDTDMHARVQANLNKLIDESLDKTAQSTAQLVDKTKVQEQINALMIQNNVSETVAAKQVADAITLQQLREIAEQGNLQQQIAATLAIERRTVAQNNQNAADTDAALIAFAQSITNSDPKREKPNQENFGLDYNAGLDDPKKDAQSIITLENQTYAARLANRQHYLDQIKAMTDAHQLTEKQGILAVAQYDANTLQSRLHNTDQILSAIGTLTGAKSKELQAIGKAASIAQATMDMYAAINKALAALPYPADLPGAIAVGIEGAVNIAKIAGLKDGGYIQGPGGSRDDQVPLWGSNGEFMVNAQATANYRPLLEQINRGGHVTPAAFAAGGIVGNSASAGHSFGGQTIVYDFSGSDFSGSDPEAVKGSIRHMLDMEYTPKITQTAVKASVKAVGNQSHRQTLNPRLSR